MKPGGRFGIVNWHPRPRNETTALGEPRGPKTELRLSVEATIKAVEAGGLKLAYVADVPPYHYAAVFDRRLGAEGRGKVSLSLRCMFQITEEYKDIFICT